MHMYTPAHAAVLARAPLAQVSGSSAGGQLASGGRASGGRAAASGRQQWGRAVSLWWPTHRHLSAARCQQPWRIELRPPAMRRRAKAAGTSASSRRGAKMVRPDGEMLRVLLGSTLKHVFDEVGTRGSYDWRFMKTSDEGIAPTPWVAPPTPGRLRRPLVFDFGLVAASGIASPRRGFLPRRPPRPTSASRWGPRRRTRGGSSAWTSRWPARAAAPASRR